MSDEGSAGVVVACMALQRSQPKRGPEAAFATILGVVSDKVTGVLQED